MNRSEQQMNEVVDDAQESQEKNLQKIRDLRQKEEDLSSRFVETHLAKMDYLAYVLLLSTGFVIHLFLSSTDDSCLDIPRESDSMTGMLGFVALTAVPLFGYSLYWMLEIIRKINLANENEDPTKESSNLLTFVNVMAGINFLVALVACFYHKMIITTVAVFFFLIVMCVINSTNDPRRKTKMAIEVVSMIVALVPVAVHFTLRGRNAVAVVVLMVLFFFLMFLLHDIENGKQKKIRVELKRIRKEIEVRHKNIVAAREKEKKKMKNIVVARKEEKKTMKKIQDELKYFSALIENLENMNNDELKQIGEESSARLQKIVSALNN